MARMDSHAVSMGFFSSIDFEEGVGDPGGGRVLVASGDGE